MAGERGAAGMVARIMDDPASGVSAGTGGNGGDRARRQRLGGDGDVDPGRGQG